MMPVVSKSFMSALAACLTLQQLLLFVPAGAADAGVSMPSLLRGGDGVAVVPSTTTAAADPVDVLVLVESLCPGCEQFIRTILTDAYFQLGPLVINLTVIPFGNAKVVDPDTHEVKCQHGLGECDGNVYELCAIHLYPQPEQYLPFLECLTHKLNPGYDNSTIHPCAFKGCATEHHLSWPAIEACHKNDYWPMLQDAAEKTPAHDYVPWIVVEEEHVEMTEDMDFVTVICEAFQKKGGSYPACTGRKENQKPPLGEPLRRYPVCRANDVPLVDAE